MTATFIELGHAGRMGNALFQIAATIGYAKKYGVDFCFPKWEHQNILSIPQEFFVDINLINVRNKYSEPGYLYSEIPFKENCSLSGYFQSSRYFENCKEYIKEIFTPKETHNLNDYCCIHVRRGDYLRYPLHHPIQTIQHYYMRAIEKIPVNKFMVFSDDIEWCRCNFKGNEFTINDTYSIASDFSKMINCSHFIIANSSFSWWVAWLSRNKNKVVVAPSNWFGPALKEANPISDLIPPEWILI